MIYTFTQLKDEGYLCVSNDVDNRRIFVEIKMLIQVQYHLRHFEEGLFVNALREQCSGNIAWALDTSELDFPVWTYSYLNQKDYLDFCIQVPDDTEIKIRNHIERPFRENPGLDFDVVTDFDVGYYNANALWNIKLT